jgi:NitT/TauT family transport system permease protein
MDLTQLILSLVIDTSASWLRMFVALFISMGISLGVGIYAAKSERASRIILPIIDVLQTLPILAFFPFVIYVVLAVLPPAFGINAAVVFLIITSMLWNMIFGVYEAIKTLPNELSDVAALYRMNIFQKLRKVYVPAAMPRLIEQSVLSWAIGLFYLVTSEIFSTGNASYAVTHGIGVALTQLALAGNYTDYGIGLAIFIIFVIATRFLFFKPLEKYFNRSSDRQIITKTQAQRQHTRFGLFKELDYIYKNRLAGTIKRRIKSETLKGLPPSPTHLLIEQQRKASARLKIYAAVAVVLILILLAAIGVINATTIGYEELSAVSLLFSFARVWITFAVIIVIAIPVCVYLIFMVKTSEHYLTLFQILASIPATIVLPIIVVALAKYPAHSELVAFAVFFLSGIWYIIFSVLAEAKSLQRNVFDVKKIFHVKGWKAWKDIYFKAITPGLITGAVTGIAAEWNASIVAEYFTSTGVGAGTVVSSVGTGIGKLLDTSLASGNLTLMLIALINLTIMIILVNTFVWKKLYKRMSDIYK